MQFSFRRQSGLPADRDDRVSLPDHFTRHRRIKHGVEYLPIVDVVQVDRAGERAAVIPQTARVEDALARRVVVAVAEDRQVVTLDVGQSELGQSHRFDPLLKPAVCGFETADERPEGFLFKAESLTGHRVEPCAEAVVAWCKFAGGFEAEFQPEAWEVESTEGTGDSAANQWDVFHGLFALDLVLISNLCTRRCTPISHFG